ncbi:hypothetical protein [uncultured Pseudoteredinibacter sp.]|uniref:hypothetical protein n=1 Tax=uncultured Pseudoteredinibacter sp. TaxID=1641701 RepID=UPI002619A9F5|nr:hypothetical protein [uncultured Pseudoteredinibacter sp.]
MSIKAKALLLFTMILAVQACTQQDIYEMAQDNRKQACHKEPLALQEQCRQQYEQSFAEYQRERKALLEDGKK